MLIAMSVCVCWGGGGGVCQFVCGWVGGWVCASGWVCVWGGGMCGDNKNMCFVSACTRVRASELIRVFVFLVFCCQRTGIPSLNYTEINLLLFFFFFLVS